jgi:hypothetical protein
VQVFLFVWGEDLLARGAQLQFVQLKMKIRAKSAARTAKCTGKFGEKASLGCFGSNEMYILQAKTPSGANVLQPTVHYAVRLPEIGK